jgi:hypothetical protein
MIETINEEKEIILDYRCFSVLPGLLNDCLKNKLFARSKKAIRG